MRVAGGVVVIVAAVVAGAAAMSWAVWAQWFAQDVPLRWWLLGTVVFVALTSRVHVTRG